MPPLPKKYTKKHRRRVVKVDAFDTGRWECPMCGAIHHFDASDGCHNDNCHYEGRLDKIERR